MSKKNNNNSEMSFLDHLEEFRWHIIRSLIAILIFAILAFIFHYTIFDDIIFLPKSKDFFTNRLLCSFGNLIHSAKICINQQPLSIISIKMAGQFSTHIKVSIILGIIIAFPYVFYEFWQFIMPALHENEKKSAKGAIFFSSLLFFIGVLFGYYLIVPLSVNFLGSYSVSTQVTNQINLNSYISTVTSIVLASGVVFELPILVYFLSKAGIVSPEFLRKYRKHSLVLILALSAIITPPDIFSQILVSIPLVILYEISIMISNKIVKKKESNSKAIKKTE